MKLTARRAIPWRRWRGTNTTGSIRSALDEVTERHKTGLYIDLHGHGHAKQRLELGYLLSASTLSLTDPQLDGLAARQEPPALPHPVSPIRFSRLLRGPSSLGGLLAPRFPSVPSPSIPSPGKDLYFDGGYSTERHTATFPGLQIEHNMSGLRASASSRARFAQALVAAIITFLATHLGITL